MFDIDSALSTLVEREGSDLHVKVDSPPILRVHGQLSYLEGHPPLTAEDTEKAFHDIAEVRSLTEFEEDGEADYSYAISGRRPLPRQHLQAARLDLDRLSRHPLRDPLDR